MNHSFSAWERRRRHIPEADRLVPLIASAGQIGMTRSQIGAAVDLDREVLDELLRSLVNFGLLAASEEGDRLIFRAGGGGMTLYQPPAL